jgi:hypothetical protein
MKTNKGTNHDGNSENNEENPTSGPAESGEQGSERVAGPSPEISQREDEMSGTETAGKEENSEMKWGKKHVNAGPAAIREEPVLKPVRNVFRKTELHGAIRESTTVKSRKTPGRKMESRARSGVMMSYHAFEVAFKDLICSLMERQDRMNEEIFYKISDLVYRVDDIEQDRTGEGGRK